MSVVHATAPTHRLRPPAAGFLPSLVAGMVAVAVLALSNILFGNRPWSDHVPGFLLLGVSIALFGWGGNRLWQLTVGMMTAASPRWVGYAGRIPFWYLWGAIGYVLGLLAAKKFALLTVYDIPVKPLFQFGGLVGIATQVPLRWLHSRITAHNENNDAGRTA
jgi:hypothetical protein